MTIHLDHTIVPARDKVASARRLAELLGVPWTDHGPGPFAPVYVNDGLTLDFIDTDEAFPIYHFCFRVDDEEVAAHGKILSDLEAVERAAIDQDFVVLGVELAASFEAARPDLAERFGDLIWLGRTAHRFLIVDRQRHERGHRR